MLNAPAYALDPDPAERGATTPKGIVHIDENTEVELREEFEERKRRAARRQL
jgi:transitional endoplasmic reticulum ATPase